MLQRDVTLLEQPQHALARRRRIVVRDDRLRGHVLHRHLPAPGERVGRRHEQHELVAADRHLEQPFFGRTERQRAEIEAALLHLDGNLPRRARGARRWRCRDSAGETARSAAAACARPPRWRRSARGRAAGRGARAPPTRSPRPAAPAAARSSAAPCPASVSVPRLRRPVEELLAEVGFETPDRLADRRLGPVDLGGGARKAALLGDGEKDLQGGEIHKIIALLYRNHYHFDF